MATAALSGDVTTRPCIRLLVVDGKERLYERSPARWLATDTSQVQLAVQVASCPQAALTLLQGSQPSENSSSAFDLAVALHQPPEADARSFLQLAEARFVTLPIPVAVVLASSDLDTASELRQLGASDCVTKPLEALDLQRITLAFSGRQAMQAEDAVLHSAVAAGKCSIRAAALPKQDSGSDAENFHLPTSSPSPRKCTIPAAYQSHAALDNTPNQARTFSCTRDLTPASNAFDSTDRRLSSQLASSAADDSGVAQSTQLPSQLFSLATHGSVSDAQHFGGTSARHPTPAMNQVLQQDELTGVTGNQDTGPSSDPSRQAGEVEQCAWGANIDKDASDQVDDTRAPCHGPGMASGGTSHGSGDAVESPRFASQKAGGAGVQPRGGDMMSHASTGQSGQGFRAYVARIPADLAKGNMPHFMRSNTASSGANSVAAFNNNASSGDNPGTNAMELSGGDDASRCTNSSEQADGSAEEQPGSAGGAGSAEGGNQFLPPGSGKMPQWTNGMTFADFAHQYASVNARLQFGNMAALQPFWMQSNAQANANEQAEMAAFCAAYAQTAAAAQREQGELGSGLPDLQRHHMLMSMQHHVFYQQQMMMQHLMLASMFSGAGAGGQQQQQQKQQQGTQPSWASLPTPPLAGNPWPTMSDAGSMPAPSSTVPASRSESMATGRATSMPAPPDRPWPGQGPPPGGKPAGQQNQSPAPSSMQPQPSTSMDPSPSQPLSQQDRRTLALNKYRLKRKNLCFTKKIRYESRKQLAKARPRIKGQFVRRESVELSEIGAHTAQQLAARDAAEAVMQLANAAATCANTEDMESEEDEEMGQEDGNVDLPHLHAVALLQQAAASAHLAALARPPS